MVNVVKGLVLFFLLASCGVQSYTQRRSITAQHCTVIENPGDITILCPDGTSAVIPKPQDGADGAAGTSCIIEQLDTGAVIRCSDGSHAYINNGKDGNDGTDGTAGDAGTDGQDGEPGPQGPAGDSGTDGNNGQDGKDGAEGTAGTDGETGTDGTDGTSCTVHSVPDGAIIECGDGSSVLIRHGKDKKTGKP